jgi:glycosyltransferase involved in cell wall biosynthesis
VPFIAPPPRGPIERRPPPSFSVIIPAYQAASTVCDAVSSALAQTYPAHEVVVVDDGSTDDLAGALSAFGSRISVVRKENGGAASALNAGLAACTGGFVAILDADDIYGPRRLEVLGELVAARPDLDIVTTDMWFALTGEMVGRFCAANPFVAIGQRVAILRSCFTGGCPAVRTSRLLAIGGFDESLARGYDWDLCIRLILAGSLAGLVDEPHLEYRQHSQSLTSARVASLWDRVRVLEKARRHPGLRPDERPALARSLRDHRTRAIFAEVEAGLAHGAMSRRRLLDYAASTNVTGRTRTVLALCAAAPRVGQRYLSKDPGALEARFHAQARLRSS